VLGTFYPVGGRPPKGKALGWEPQKPAPTQKTTAQLLKAPPNNVPEALGKNKRKPKMTQRNRSKKQPDHCPCSERNQNGEELPPFFPPTKKKGGVIQNLPERNTTAPGFPQRGQTGKAPPPKSRGGWVSQKKTTADRCGGQSQKKDRCLCVVFWGGKGDDTNPHGVLVEVWGFCFFVVPPVLTPEKPFFPAPLSNPFPKPLKRGGWARRPRGFKQ